MKHFLMFIGLAFSLMLSACSTSATPAPVQPFPDQSTRGLPTILPAESTPLPLSATLENSPVPQPASTLPAETATIIPTITIVPTSTSTPPPSCSAPDGYAWSFAYGPGSSYIAKILSLGDGNFLLSGLLQDLPGTWLVKMDPGGQLLWQNVYGSALGMLKSAPNGNIVLEFDRSNLEIAPDGTLVRTVTLPWYFPSVDGSFTVISGAQVARFKADQSLIWQVGIKDLSANTSITSDGGAIFAYAGSYADTSVYWAPIVTDIKVIKVDGNGQVWQRTYGRAVGDEMLDTLIATDDGGALLSGTHAYGELGEDYDIWLMKVNATGGMSWQTTLQLAPRMETLEGLYPLISGYAILASSNYGETLTLIFLKPNGSLNWQKAISSSRGGVRVNTMADTPDGDLLLAGETLEKTSVYWLARLDSRGNLLWEKTIGYYDIPDASQTEIESILPLADGDFLLAGNTDLVGSSVTSSSQAWVARVHDSGEKLGLLKLSPGKYNFITSLGSRPQTLPDSIIEQADIRLSEITSVSTTVNLQSVPACLGPGAQIPTPAALPSLTPTVTATPSFVHTLYLTDPLMQGDDVLKLQQRLLELGYTDVGTPDGYFGRMTDAAVRAFQTRNNLDVDGIVGPKTWELLFSTRAKPMQ